MLTLQDLKDMKPGTSIATGVTIDNSQGVNMSNSNRMLRWIAFRGEIHDWAIYIGLEDAGWEFIKSYGDKVHDKENIRKLVPCDDESFKMYRH